MVDQISKEKIERWFPFIVLVSIFIFLYIFFSKIHPIVIFDQDDWDYISNYRKPFPLWGAWNPTRVLPEILMPLAGYFAAYIVTPLVGDYVLAVTITSALIVAFGISSYYLIFKVFLTETWNINCIQIILVSLFFILAHFGLFRSLNENNAYMFWANDLTCYYFYLIPSLINAGLVLYLMKTKNFFACFQTMSNLKKGTIGLMFYLALFSNLFSSGILGVYCIVKLVISRNTSNWQEVKFYRIIFGLWIFVLLFEANGKDAAKVGGAYSYLHLPLGDTFSAFLGLARTMDWSYVGLLVICLVGSIWVYKCVKLHDEVENTYKTIMSEISFCLILMFIFLLLLCAKVTPSYAGRGDVTFGFFFYVLLLIFNAGSYLLRRTSNANILLPFVLLVFVVIGTNPCSPFKESNYSPYECMAVSRNFISQARESEGKGQHIFVLKVPKGSADLNWPHPPSYFGNILARTLSAHGLVKHKIKINVQVDPEMNKIFYK